MDGVFDSDRLVIVKNGTTEYECNYCENKVAGVIVATYNPNPAVGNEFPITEFLICPCCGVGSVMLDDFIYPPRLEGDGLRGLDEKVGSAYREARICFSHEAYTASVMMCRKILMHVAVNKRLYA